MATISRAQRAVLERLVAGEKISTNPRQDYEAWWGGNGDPINARTFQALLVKGFVEGDGMSLHRMVISDEGRAAIRSRRAEHQAPEAVDAGTGEAR